MRALCVMRCKLTLVIHAYPSKCLTVPSLALNAALPMMFQLRLVRRPRHRPRPRCCSTNTNTNTDNVTYTDTDTEFIVEDKVNFEHGHLMLYRRNMDLHGNDEYAEAIKCHQAITKNVAIICIPELQNVQNILKIAHMDQTDANSSTHIEHYSDTDDDVNTMCHESKQHALIINFKNQNQAMQFFNAVNGHSFWKRREVAFAFYVSSLTVVDENKANDTTIEANTNTGYHQLPICPRCLMRLDTAVTGLVYYERGFAARKHDKRRGLWPEVLCRVCDLLAYHRSALACANASLMTSPSQITDAHGIAHQISASLLTYASKNSTHCRRTQLTSSDPSRLLRCSTCKTTAKLDQSLWICMLCSNVGCGRYTSSHAVQHFVKSDHHYSIDALNLFIWGYDSDSYVHRVASGLSSTDLLPQCEGSTSESDDSDESSMTLSLQRSLSTHLNHRVASFNTTEPNDTLRAHEGEEESEMLDAKMQSITQYYNQQLSLSLSKQYSFFDGKIQNAQTRSRENLDHLQREVENYTKQAEKAKDDLKQLKRDYRKVEKLESTQTELIARQKEENQIMEELIKSLSLRIDAISSSAGEQKSTKNTAKKLQKQLLDKDSRIAALQKQLADVMSLMDKQINKPL